jgi:NAD+ synthase (glutamine-hydrolysing)
MCRLVVEACNAGNEQVLQDVRMICAEDPYIPESPRELCNRIFHTCFMGSTNSSAETRSRARDLSKAIGGVIKIGT